jgi:hypothetical protein
VVSHDEFWPAKVRDLSARGVGIVVPRSFERGTQLGLDVSGTDLTRLSMTVVFAHDLGNSSWHIGCSFPAPLSEDARQRLEGHISSGADDEERVLGFGPVTVRMRADQRVVELRSRDGQEGAVHLYAVDESHVAVKVDGVIVHLRAAVPIRAELEQPAK